MVEEKKQFLSFKCNPYPGYPIILSYYNKLRTSIFWPLYIAQKFSIFKTKPTYNGFKNICFKLSSYKVPGQCQIYNGLRNWNFGIYFLHLTGSFDIFRKSHKFIGDFQFDVISYELVSLCFLLVEGSKSSFSHFSINLSALNCSLLTWKRITAKKLEMRLNVDQFCVRIS